MSDGIKKEDDEEMNNREENGIRETKEEVVDERTIKKEQSEEEDEEERVSTEKASRRSILAAEFLPERARRGSGGEVMDDRSISRAERDAERKKAAQKMVMPRAFFK